MKFFFLVMLVSFSSHAVACICWFGTDKKSVKEKIDQADVILYATVVPESLNGLRVEDSSLYVTEVIFKVHEVWKGANLKTIKFDQKVYPCRDADFRIGERYIIFGYLNSQTEKLETNNCNSLAEGFRPYPFDGYGDIKRYQDVVHWMNQEFDSVKRFITKKTRKRKFGD